MKKIYTFSNYLILTGLVLWLLQKLYFLLSFGWHTTPQSNTETMCVIITGTVFYIGLWGWFWCTHSIIDAIIQVGEVQPRKPLNPE